MGGKLSSEYSSYGSSASSWDPQQGYLQSPYNRESPTGHRPQSQPSASSPPDYPPRPAYSAQPSYSAAPDYPTQPSYAVPQDYPPPGYHGVPAHRNRRRLDKRYSQIADSYSSLEQVTEALARAGLESSNLLVGIDFTKSNEWTGAKSFNKRSLHHIGAGLNPYEQAISIIGRTLAAFDDDNLIPCFGFGDASTHDQDVFGFHPDERCCHGFEEVLHRYREIVPHLKLAGPTSFAPIIEMAMTIVEKSGGQYHVLLIIADGQVTRSVDTEPGHLSPQEQNTVEAIVEASKFPLSIILVGVGDGPWDTMQEFDDNIPARDFDNFQFVNFTHIMSKNVPPTRKETEFALTALMEVPTQYRATVELGLLGSRKAESPQRFPLPPPVYSTPSMGSTKLSRPLSFEPTQPSIPSYYGDSIPPTQPSIPSYYGDSMPHSSAPPVETTTYENQICPICLTNIKDMAFGCGHQTCRDCGQYLELCPVCRTRIETRIKLY